jgi:hypothetical protein
MATASTRFPSDKWDLARLGADFGAAGQATWAETYAARLFAVALIEQPEFVEHTRAIRSGTSADVLAARYVRRAQGRRVEAVAIFLRAAAAAEPHAREVHAKARVLNVGTRAWWSDGRREPGQPQRNLRPDAMSTLEYAAVRLARRGAGRCTHADCAGWRGAKLASDRSADHCAEHAWMDRQPRRFVECDRAFFRALLPAVLDRRWE